MKNIELKCEKCKNVTFKIITVENGKTVFKCSNCSNEVYITSGVPMTDTTHNTGNNIITQAEQLTLQFEDTKYGRVIPFPINSVRSKERYLSSLLDKEEKYRKKLTEIILTKDEAVWLGITSNIYIDKIKAIKKDLPEKNNSHLSEKDQLIILEKKQKFYESIQNIVVEYISKIAKITIITPLTIDIIQFTENLPKDTELSLSLDYISLEYLNDIIKTTIDSIYKKEITNHLINNYLQALESVYKKISPVYNDITRSIDMIWEQIGDILEAE